MLSTSAFAVDWGGYTRIGPGQKENAGDGKRCYDGGGAAGFGSAAPGHGGIGRLGNECNTYGEFALSQGGKAGGVDFKALLMTNFYSAGSTPDQATDVSSGNHGDNTPRVAQLYVEGKGFDIYPAASFWVGRRFYVRSLSPDANNNVWLQPADPVMHLSRTGVVAREARWQWLYNTHHLALPRRPDGTTEQPAA